jgi:hypothetical protein
VSITDSDRESVESDVKTFEFQERALSALQDLWRIVDQGTGAEFVSISKEGTEEDEDGISLLALRLATERGVPLIADDRVLQAVVNNQRGSATNSAYGTADLLKRLFEDGSLDLESYAQSFLQLMRWRYKFLLPPAELLHFFARSYADAVPGFELTAVAQYLHDCMSDPGLLGGLESSTPPVSMALRLYISWHSTIGDFLGAVWTDDEIPESRAQAITAWVSKFMFPGVPISITEQFHPPMARNVREVAITSALIRATTNKVTPSVPKLLQQLASELGVSQRRLWQIYVEVINRVAH